MRVVYFPGEIATKRFWCRVFAEGYGVPPRLAKKSEYNLVGAIRWRTWLYMELSAAYREPVQVAWEYYKARE